MGEIATLLWGCVIGVVSGLASSILFLIYLNGRMKVAISPVITKQKGAEGDWEYEFKVINRTSVPLINVSFRAWLFWSVYAPGGVMYTSTTLDLSTTEVMEIAAFDRKDADRRFAWRIQIRDDLDALLERGDLYGGQIAVYASDSFTGYRKSFSRTFGPDTNPLREGSFELGNSFKVRS